MLDRRIRQLLEDILPFLAIIISTLPPCNDTNLYAVLSHVILILSSLPTPPPNQMLPFMQRLDQQFMGHIFRGADLFHNSKPTIFILAEHRRVARNIGTNCGRRFTYYVTNYLAWKCQAKTKKKCFKYEK